MRAALYRDMGEAAEVFCVEEVDRPEPGPGEVLVRVHASGVNPTDYKARSGAVPRPIDDFQIPHQDGAGVIEARTRRMSLTVRTVPRTVPVTFDLPSRG